MSLTRNIASKLNVNNAKKRRKVNCMVYNDEPDYVWVHL